MLKGFSFFKTLEENCFLLFLIGLYFKYTPIKNSKKQFSSKVLKKENPFSILKNINFK